MTKVTKQYACESARQMTQEHRKMCNQFINFKERTFKHLEQMEDWHSRMKASELAISQRNPVTESYYATNDNTSVKDKNQALGLYNCLVPKIQASSYRMDNYLTSYNQKDILREMQIEKLINLDISADDKQYNTQILKHKNRVLKFQLQSMKEQMQVIDWYIQTLEDGINSATVMKEYLELKKQHKKFQKEHDEYK